MHRRLNGAQPEQPASDTQRMFKRFPVQRIGSTTTCGFLVASIRASLYPAAMNLVDIQHRCQVRFLHGDEFAGSSNSERAVAE